ncbi:MAG TPA: STAS domain-containing protein [Acidimicrobiales bacterium]|nr:STAS domain-containing protein [Acidimicrobiales bacterium]
MPKPFDIDVTDHGGVLVAHLAGELDLVARDSVTAELAPRVAAAGVDRLVVDMAEVTFCDSSGLAALLDVRRAAEDAGVDMVLRSVTRQVERLLDLADVDGHLTRE